jgi:hypothetical protein
MKLMQKIGQNNLWQVIVVVNNFKIIKILVIICSLMQISCTQNIESKRWVYKDVFKPARIFSIEQNPDSFGIGDVMEEATFCSEKQKYYCINSTSFHFSVPKGALKAHKSWSYQTYRYFVEAIAQRSILGIQGEVFIIQSKQGEHTIKFWYSPTHGLIAFGGSSVNAAAFYALEGLCGFASKARCEN